MGSPDTNKGYLVAGRMAYGCSNLATSWPHGGTGLGLVGDVFVFPQRRWISLPQEETNSASTVVWLGGDVVVGFTLFGWDADAVNFLFPNTTLSNTHRLPTWPGSTVVAGQQTTSYTNLVFTPNNAAHPGFVIYKPAPVPDVNAQLAASAYRYLEVPAVVIALPDASDRLGKFGKFSELTL